MHEHSLLRALMHQLEATAQAHGAARVKVVRLKLGPLAHIEPDHLREHFNAAAKGTLAEDARLEIAVTDELHELTLESLDIEASKPPAGAWSPDRATRPTEGLHVDAGWRPSTTPGGEAGRPLDNPESGTPP
jgi:hydrogenase nickel incorporation protein HypA/HybF